MISSNEGIIGVMVIIMLYRLEMVMGVPFVLPVVINFVIIMAAYVSLGQIKYYN